MSLHYLRKIE
jgi:hypothetical protein